VSCAATLHVKSRKEAVLRAAKLLEEYAKQLDEPLKPEAEPELQKREPKP
jgi:hypothetical protein